MSYNSIRYPARSAQAEDALRKARDKRDRRAAKRAEPASSRSTMPRSDLPPDADVFGHVEARSDH